MKKIEKYIDSRFKDLSRNLRSYDKDSDAESLHRVRVDIKRIKAVINLAGEHDKKFKAHKAFKPLRNIFRDAGGIRQPEVLFQLLLKHGVTDIGRDGLLDTDYSLIDEFIDNIPLLIGTCKDSKNDLLKHARKLNHKVIIKSNDKAEKRLKKSLTGKIKFESIHKTRKLIKQFLYLSEIYDSLRKKHRKFFDDLAELIGLVHDKQMLMTLLKKPNTPPHQKALADLQASLEGDKKVIVDKCAAFYKVNNITLI